VKRRINEAGLQLIHEFEQLRLTPYLCPSGIPTLGWGNTYYPDGTRVTLDDRTITEKEADGIFLCVLEDFEGFIERTVKVPLTDNEFAALVSFTYNVGTHAFRTSTLLKELNSGYDREEVAKQFARWNQGGGRVLNGLIRRRKAEKELFLRS
jgi:lysozyme